MHIRARYDIQATFAALMLCLSATLPLPAEDPVDFNREVRPILAARCLKCHGGVKRESGLSLLYREAALVPASSGEAAIVPGQPDGSELIRRVTTDDPDDRMPPRGDPLPAEQIETLRRWIAAGAPYGKHWAYVSPVDHPEPDVRLASWPRSGLDRFVLARLEREGLEPSGEADRAAWIRRVGLDLTGLPPTLNDIVAFENDRSEKAHEVVVDRLLDSDAFGERWAQMWLDLARYADTQGYEKDNRRTIWRYRDWVIDAFNRDLPYDRFTIEQLAGDLLPEATPDQLLATAFHRNTMTNTEGGTDDEEFRTLAIIDRVSTTWQVWMGTTFGCVQCHNHPYDPFRNEEFYRFFAFLNNTEDSDRPDEQPVIPTPTREQEARRRELDSRLAAARSKLEAPSPEFAGAQARWEASVRGPVEWRVLSPKKISSEQGSTFETLDDGSVLATGESPPTDVYEITARPGPSKLAALRLEVLPHDSLPKPGPGRAADGNFVLSRIEVLVESRGVSLKSAIADHSQGGFPAEYALKNPSPKRRGWAVAPQMGKAHRAIFEVGDPVAVPGAGELRVRLEHSFHTDGFTLGRFRLSITDEPRAVARASIPADVLAAVDTAEGERSPEQKERIFLHHRSILPELRGVREEIASLEKERKALALTRTPILRELPSGRRREPHVFIRGSFLSKGEKVEEGVPKSLHPFPKDAPRNRLGLARWIVDTRNPLTARVAVNRFWEQLFGLGLVETSEDFGTQGMPPSHPELLDWLAYRFMHDQGWSMKRLLREIVLSATYRQSSRNSRELEARDPKNLLLARGPRFRLDAEMLRDQILSVSGLLSHKMFGPSVMPPQPAGVWQVVYSGDKWATSEGEDRYRRGLYTFWRRTSPYPSMITFDAGSREACLVRRIRTNTPLQALVMLNDPVAIEAAQALARRMVSEGGKTVEERVAHGFRLCLARAPEPEEVRRLAALYRGEREHYSGHEKAAVQMATVPLGAPPEGVEIAELAAWTVVGNVLMNLDEFLTRG